MNEVSRYIAGTVDASGTDIYAGRQRASHKDRDRCITRLSACHGAGYLSPEVYEARHTAAQAAETQDTLTGLLADLPAPELPQVWWPKRLSKKAQLRLAQAAVLLVSLNVAVTVPVLIYNLTGYTVEFGTGSSGWYSFQHSAVSLAMIIISAIVGIIGTIATVVWVVDL
jgi:uncharacterized protein DUF1707